MITFTVGENLGIWRMRITVSVKAVPQNATLRKFIANFISLT